MQHNKRHILSVVNEPKIIAIEQLYDGSYIAWYNNPDCDRGAYLHLHPTGSVDKVTINNGDYTACFEVMPAYEFPISTDKASYLLIKWVLGTVFFLWLFFWILNQYVRIL